MSAIIIYSPARNLLPGYREDVRQQVVEQSARVDSLTQTLALQQQYLQMLKQVVAGDVQTDSLQPLDSVQIVMREQLLEAKNAATEEFIAQYEQKESERFQLFDIRSTTSVYTLTRPMECIVIEHYNAEQSHPYITLRSGDTTPITSVLSGVVVYTNYELDNSYSIVIQHETYLSVYQHADRLLKQVGDAVQASETIGMASPDKDIAFYLWHDGKCINPEELIAF
jgi:lipoprotein NlpD